MKSIEEQFTELQGVLYKPLLFFIPKSSITNDVLNQLDAEVTQLFDTLYLIQEDGACYRYTNQPILYSLFQKKSNLDNSIFRIFEIKKQLEEKQFNFFIQRYLTFVDVYVYISNWLVENIELYKEDLTDELQQAFNLQQEYLKQHLDDLKQHCLLVNSPLKKEKEIIIDFIKDGIPELKELLTKKNNEEAEKKKLENQDEVEIKEKTKIVKEKAVQKMKENRITEIEAELFLMESVFNVKINKEEK